MRLRILKTWDRLASFCYCCCYGERMRLQILKTWDRLASYRVRKRASNFVEEQLTRIKKQLESNGHVSSM